MSERSRRTQRPPGSSPERAPTPASRGTGSLPVSALAMRAPVVQPQLEVNEPGDRFEQEADSVAAAVQRAPAPPAPPEEQPPAEVGLQRKEQADSGLPLAGGLRPDDDERVQRVGEGKPPVTARTTATIRQPGPGSPLSSGVRRRVEPHLGVSLAHVRVHSGPQAHEAAHSLQARAFTYGSHIFLNRNESSQNVGLLAHEATHVVQQGAAPLQRQPDAPAGVIQRLSLADVAETVDDIPGIDLPEALLSLLRRIEAAGGIFPYLEELVSGVVDRIFGGLEQGAATITGLVENFRQLFAATAALAAAIVSGDREGFAAAVISLTDALRVIVGDAWDALEALLGPVGNFLDSVLTMMDEPIGAWIERVAGSVWETVVGIGQNVWNWTAELRDSWLGGQAWSQIRGLLGITGPDTFAGLVAWVQGVADNVWQGIKRQFGSVISAMQSTVGTVRELIALENIRALRETVDAWIVTARDFVLALNADEGRGAASQQDLLRDVLIPAIRAGAETLRALIIAAGQWVAGLIGNLAARVTGFIDSLRAVPLLSAVPELFTWVSDAVGQLATWAQETVIGLFTAVGNGVQALLQFVEPVLRTLINLVTATADLLNNLPALISGAWEAIPAWIRNPIKDFVLNEILGRIPLFGELVRNPELWSRVQETAMRILQQIFVSGDLRGAAWTFFEAMLALIQIPTELATAVISKTVAVFNDILQNPAGFFINLLQAIKAGFSNFFSNIVTHLLSGIQVWLLGQAAEAGIQPPQDFSLGSIFRFVLDVLGISMDLIWQRLALKIGDERVAQIRRALNVLAGAWEWISVAINEGPAALWERMQGQLSELWNQVLNGVIGWVTQTIIEKVTVKLLSMLDPTGIMAVVNSVIALYNAIESAIQYFVRILEIVNKVLDGIQGIVSGAIATAAGFLESALADALPVAIGFLANQVGLGRIGEKLGEMIQMVRGYVVRAVDWLIDQALRIGGAVLERLGLGGGREGEGEVESTTPTGAVDAEGVTEPVEKGFTLGSEGHTLRARTDADGGVTFLIASATFNSLIRTMTGVGTERGAYLRTLGENETAAALEADIRILVDDLVAADSRYQSLPAGPARDTQLQQELTRIGAELNRLFERYDIRTLHGERLEAFPPPHDPVYGGNDAYGRASSVRATLSVRSRDYMTSSNTTAVRDVLPGRTILPGYQAGHLLAASLGGSNADLDNFAPMSARTNNSLGGFTGRESALYRDLNSEDAVTPPPYIIRYQVTCRYPRTMEQLQGWLAANFDAGSNAAANLFRMAQTQSQLTAAAVHNALAGNSSLAQVQARLGEIQRQLALHFMPGSFAISIAVEQGENLRLPQTGPVNNHQ